LTKIFDKNSATGTFTPHHPAAKNVLALDKLILTYNRYNTVYDTMPVKDQFVLKKGIQKLFAMGIEGMGTGKNNKISEDDIRTLFYGKKFTFSHKGKKMYDIPILTEYKKDSTGRYVVDQHGLWDYYFDKISFNDKLATFNTKIEQYRSKLKTGGLKAAYMTLLDPFPIARSRFLSKAEKFANRMVAVLEDNLSIELIFFYISSFFS
jgi:hypothetical protein